jgi:S1-C subfamily serine protease
MPEKVKDTIQEVIDSSIPASCTIYCKTRKQQWSGSGFHVGNGYVCTASHVCTPDLINEGEVSITFDQETFFNVSVLKSDPNVDSAILSIKGEYGDIPSVMLANSDSVSVGEICAVIGAPEGWSDTVTVGRVSNVNQSMGDQAPTPAWNDVIFVDAKILQGVSGGMCIGTDGLVIGSIIGVTGALAEYGIGQNVVCPSNKIINLLKS